MSDYLFARPSPWYGVARLVDLFGAFDEYNGSESEAEADAPATFSDWLAVGNDIRRAAEEYTRQQKLTAA